MQPTESANEPTTDFAAPGAKQRDSQVNQEATLAGKERRASGKGSADAANQVDDRALLLLRNQPGADDGSVRNRQLTPANDSLLINDPATDSGPLKSNQFSSTVTPSTTTLNNQASLRDGGKLRDKRATGGAGAGQINRGSTIMSSSAATGSMASKAYLASDNERHKRKLAKARERRATLILGIIMTAFICSWLPFFTFYVVRALCIVCREYMPPRFEAFIFWMGYCNSAINPIIYTIFNRDFRRAFRKIIFRC